MRQRGRVSAASLSVVPSVAVLPGDRPDPPAELSKDEAAEWCAIVQQMPPQWFGRETWPVLVELCGLITTSRRVARELAQVSRRSLKEDANFSKFKMLSRMKLQHAEAIGNLSTKLRLTHQSRYERDTAANARRQTSQRPKPWEIGREDHSLDRGHLPRPGREIDWETVPFNGLAEVGDQSDLRQPGGDAPRDPELREEERQDQFGGGAAAVPPVRPGGDPE
jgi:hypothetical protein